MNMPMTDGAWGCGPMATMGLLGLAGLIVVAGLIAGAVWLVRRAWDRTGRAASPAGAGESPLDILRRRYAAGELTRVDFDRMRRELAASS
jgi:putative membrane protein